jgi:hypothetical protein
MNDFTPNEDYIKLLTQHASLSKKLRAYATDEYKWLQKKLLKIELEISTNDIIQNTKIAFPFSQHE